MKKAIIVLFALLLALGAAGVMAETAPPQREETIHLEGMEETFLATQYTKPGQFSLWYGDADFEPTKQENGVRFALRNNFLNADVYLDIARVGEPGADASALLEQGTQAYREGGWQLTAADPESFPLENAQVLGLVAAKDNQVARAYAVTLSSGVYLVTITYPMEAAEGWGARMFHFALTLENAG